MKINPAEFTISLREKVEAFDRPAVSRLCDELIAYVLKEDAPYPPKEAERVLQILRNKRMFTAMRRVADALIQSECPSLKVRRQYAQSLIDDGELTAALAVLSDLAVLAVDNPEESAEARGLIGRVYKQFYIRAGNPQSERHRKSLRRAINAYLEVYNSAPAERLWHGINVVALLKRAARDGIPTDEFPDPATLAAEILAEVGKKDVDGNANMWDFGTAVEACIALAKPESALRWLERYLAAPYSDAFELASTLHQFTAVWQLDVQSEPGSSVLPLLRAHLLARSGGSLDVTRQELTTYQHASVDVMYEKVLGDDSYKTYKWYMTGAQRCLLVARIGRDATQGFGTGFVVKGSDISPTFGDDLVLVTNAHVVTDDVAVRKAHKALPPEEAVITFEALGPEEYRIDKVLFTSRPEELDATVLKLENAKALNDKLRDKAARLARALPLVEESARIYIIGHPRGGTLSLSMADNALLDHEDPRIHYRTPTDEGSSGSPIFNRQWELIGLHHAGGENMARLNKKPGTYAANEGIWLNAIVKAIAVRPG